MGAPYASGSRNDCAGKIEVMAATGVRAGCTTTGTTAHLTLSHPNF